MPTTSVLILQSMRGHAEVIPITAGIAPITTAIRVPSATREDNGRIKGYHSPVLVEYHSIALFRISFSG